LRVALPDRIGTEGRGSVQGNTRENSTKVHYVSITFLLAFEWNGKTLKCLQVRVKFPILAGHYSIDTTKFMPRTRTEPRAANLT